MTNDKSLKKSPPKKTPAKKSKSTKPKVAKSKVMPEKPKVDNLKEKSSSWGGIREGAGRPLGSMNEQSKLRMKIKQELQNRISLHVDRLFAAQLTVAEGVTMLFKIEKDSKGNKKKPELVSDQPTIQRFIEECGGYDGEMDGDTYYFLTTKAPDNAAINSMLDRAFGKSDAKVEVDSTVTHDFKQKSDDELQSVVDNYFKEMERVKKSSKRSD